MFFCQECQDANKWPGIIPMSYGSCEVCGKTARCYDVPSKYLTPRKEEPSKED